MGQSELVSSVKAYIAMHYMEDSLNITSIAYHVRRNPKYLARIFRAETGEKLLDYINKIRIQQAVVLLRTGMYSVKSVGELVGYTTYRTFGRVFFQNMGTTPGRYLENEGYSKKMVQEIGTF